MILKKNEKEIKTCTKCGKELSTEEVEKGATKCENCIGKDARKTKTIIAWVGSGAAVVVSAVIFIATRGKKGKL